jgi:hypothetical protein
MVVYSYVLESGISERKPVKPRSHSGSKTCEDSLGRMTSTNRGVGSARWRPFLTPWESELSILRPVTGKPDTGIFNIQRRWRHKAQIYNAGRELRPDFSAPPRQRFMTPLGISSAQNAGDSAGNIVFDRLAA